MYGYRKAICSTCCFRSVLLIYGYMAKWLKSKFTLFDDFI